MSREQSAEKNSALNDRKERAAGRQQQRSRQPIREFQEDFEKQNNSKGARREGKTGKRAS